MGDEEAAHAESTLLHLSAIAERQHETTEDEEKRHTRLATEIEW